MSIIRIGLSESSTFANGWDAVFGRGTKMVKASKPVKASKKKTKSAKKKK